MRTVTDGRPERTRTGYAQDWASWNRFCAACGVPLLAVTPGALVMFVEWLWTTRPGPSARPWWMRSRRSRRRGLPSSQGRRSAGTPADSPAPGRENRRRPDSVDVGLHGGFQWARL
ncbi:hypothetical protein [Streptomyces sp. NPDC005046]